MAAPLLAPGKPLALVAYLACAPGRSAPRDHLATLLWSMDEQTDARHALRQLIHRLRLHLGPHAIETTRDTARLAVPCDVDRDRFLSAIDQGNVEQATAAYGGLFLPDLSFPGGREFDEWVTLERAALSRRFQIAGLHQVHRLLDAGRTRDAATLARRVRDDAPLDESAWRPLLEALAVAGDRVSGAMEISALDAMLADTECRPSPPTRALMARLRESAAAGDVSPRALAAELVGREREFSAVLSTWDDVRRWRQGHHVHVWGDGGVGKSRLLDEVVRRIAVNGVRVVRVAAAEGDAHIPWSAAARLAAALAACPGARGVAPECARQLVGLNPALSAVFSASGATDDGSSAQVRVRGLALADLVGAVAHERAVVVVLDDLHWYDSCSADALSLLLSAVDAEPVLLLTASRRPLAPLAAANRTRVVHLASLNVDQLEALIGSIAVPTSADWGHDLSVALHEGSEGNPLLAIEALQQALADGVLHVENGAWRAADLSLALQRLRTGDALRARVDMLPADDAWLMLLLSVAGRPMPWTLLAAEGAPADHARNAADRLVRDGFARLEDGRVRVAHDLIAAHILAHSEPARLAAAHAAVGRAVSRDAITAESAQVALAHLTASGEVEDAATLAVRTVAARRLAGDRRAVDAIFDELAAGAAAPWRERARTRLAWHLRWPRWRRVAVGVAATLMAGVAARQRAAAPPPPPLVLGVAVGSGDSLRLVRVPVDTTVSAKGRPIRVEDGETIATLRPRHAFAGFPRLGPNNVGVVLHQFSNDSGAFDLYRVLPSGSLARLTDAPGDDIDPDWSPDGRQVVFQSARWVREPNVATHLAVLDVGSGRVRPLTSGAVQDGRPRWSPDGTRIAFLRRSTRPGTDTALLCWVAARGGAATCHASRVEGRSTLHAWVDTRRIIAGDARANQMVVLHDVDSGREASLLTGLLTTIDVSPEQWAIGWTADSRSWEIRRGVGGVGRRLLSGSDSVDMVSWWRSGPPNALARVEHTALPPLPVNVPLAPALAARRTDGSTVDVAPGLLQWSSASPRVRVDATGARFRGLDTGSATVRLDVGGWLADSVTVRFTRQPAVGVLAEDWSADFATRWQLFGAPLPRRAVSRDSAGPASLRVNGDETFVSGVVSRNAWPATGGFGAEFIVSVPVSRDAWQRLHLELITEPRVVMGGAGGAVRCGWHYPSREEPQAFRRARAMLGNNDEQYVDAPDSRASTAWHRVRLQWFPDGSCGVAVNGRPVARGEPRAPTTMPVHIAVSGQSVGTTVAVRDLRAWRGVADGVAW